MNDENEFTKDGITFVAKEGEECAGCDFEGMSCVYRTNPCAPAKRADWRSIIWIKKDD